MTNRPLATRHWCARLLACLCASSLAHNALSAPPDADITTESLRTFDAQDFALAYDVLLGAGDLNRAFLVAQNAVKALPANHQWRLKLAQVSAWTQHPDIAAQQWLALFAMGDRTPETLRAVIEGAPLSNQPLVALQAWAALAKRQTLTDAQWQDVFALYEMAAEPLQGSLFFEAEFAANPKPFLLEFAARLAEYAGDDARAQRLYNQRASMKPFSMDMMLKAVSLMIRNNKMQDALALLQTHQHEVPPQAAEYWKLLGQVAWGAKAYDAAQAAYTQYNSLPAATLADWSRLIFLLRQEHPARAAELAIQAFQRFGSVEQLLFGLTVYSEQGDLAAQTRVYDHLSAANLELLVQETSFLTMRAQFYVQQKKWDQAWADYRRALEISPQDTDVVLASLWFLIDAERVELLPTFMRQYTPLAHKDSAYWQAFAAANQALDRHNEAIFWYTKAAQQNPQDPLLLLNYADALERTGQPGMADRMRRHAWLELKQKYPQTQSIPAANQNPQLLALARLKLMDQPGDPSLGLVRQWVSQMRGLPNAPATEQTAVLVLGWAIVSEQFYNARHWMWLRYARQSQSAPPLWGNSQVALQLQETQTMAQLLASQGPAMPIYNRYDTAHELGHNQQAVDIAFKGMSQQDDESLYDRYRQHVPGQSNYVQLEWNLDHQGARDSHGLDFETRLVVNPKLQLSLSGSRQQQIGNDAAMQALTPATDRLSRLQAQWIGTGSTTTLTMAQHDALDAWTSFSLLQSAQWNARLSVEGGIDFRAASNVSLPMQVAGYENSLYGTASYNWGRREYFKISPRFSRYYTQFDDELGSSKTLDMEFGYRVRTDYPDWRLRTYLNRQLYSPANALSSDALAHLPSDVQTAVANGVIAPISYFIPESNSNAGVCWGMGETVSGQNLQATYSKTWRPFFDLCFNQSMLNGSGTNGTVGLAGSVTGEDHLLIQLQSNSDSNAGNSSTTSLVLRYRRYF